MGKLRRQTPRRLFQVYDEKGKLTSSVPPKSGRSGIVGEHDDILTSRQQGDRLVLTAFGPWTAVHAHDLEPVIEAQASSSQPASAVDIDLSQVKPLDTFGAWLIERLARAWAARGAETRILGLPEDYRGLVDEVHDSNLKKLPPRPKVSRTIVALDTVGRSLVNAGKATYLILQMLGQVSAVWMRAMLHPTK